MTPAGPRTRPRDSLRAVERELSECERCPRLRSHCRAIAEAKRRAYRDQAYWGRPVPGFGDPEARLLLVGLAPGAHGANRTGRVFTGDSSGDFLYAALWRAGIANQPASTRRDDGLVLRGAYVSSAARCAPPQNRPTPLEMERCRPFLVREIRLLRNLRAILALGAIAWAAVRRALEEPLEEDRTAIESPQPAFGHGVLWLPHGAGRSVLASYHVSRQNTQTGRLTLLMFDAVLREAVRASGL